MENLLKITLFILILVLNFGCTEKIYNIDDLRKIGFKDSGEISIADKSRFVGTYDYIVSEGNAMELTKRYPFRIQVMATKFDNLDSANEYSEYLKSNPLASFGAYYKCFINNLYIGIKIDTEYTNYQKICDYIAIDLK